MQIKKIASFILIFPLLTACNPLHDSHPSGVDEAHALVEQVNGHESHQEHSDHNHDHDYTVDPATAVDISDPYVLKEAALEDSEFVSDLSPEELAFVKEIRPLHFDLKTMAMRVSGVGVLYFTGDADEDDINKMAAEADGKYKQLKLDIANLSAPESMKDIPDTYMDSIELYQQSLEDYQSYFKTLEPRFLEEFQKNSNQANYQIKGVIYRMWMDEFNPH